MQNYNFHFTTANKSLIFTQKGGISHYVSTERNITRP